VSDPAGLLARSVVNEFDGRVAMVVENYGVSELAKRFGVRRYPAIFVGDVLVATPKDFGFYGTGEGTGEGRYAPWKSTASHERFRADLSRMIELTLAGRTDLARSRAAQPGSEGVAALPEFGLQDVYGAPVSRAHLADRAVIVEFWATWCPPCRSTLQWLGKLKARHGDRLEVIAVAVESDSADVRALADRLGLPIRWVMGTPELARAFGDVSAVPTLHVFGREGREAGSFFGATPELHADVESRVDAILSKR
jgi:thiol-disulfide isomerase/thioredoxin